MRFPALFVSLLISVVPAWGQVCPRPTTANALALCAPGNSGTVSSPVLIYAVGGSSITTIEAWIDGVKSQQVSGNTMDKTVSLAKGQHKIVAFGKVNVSVTASVTHYFTVGDSTSSCPQPTTAGAVNICSPASGATVGNPVKVSARGGSAVDSLEAYIDGTKRGGSNSNSLSLSITLSSGQRRLTVIAKSNGAETSRKTIYFTVTTSGATSGVHVEQVASGLSIPWELVFAPDGRKFFTERRGKLRVITASGILLSTPVYEEVSAMTEAGMLGLALDPNFVTNHRIYMYHCPSTSLCKIMRLVEKDNHATVDKVLLQLRSGSYHVAGRLKIGPDGYLYAGVGDIHQAQLAQDLSSLQGKILRLTTDGAPAPGNPFTDHPYIYALGLRDPQGLAWDASGQLYGTDHGENSHDEVNIIYRGKDYGWPTCQGRCNDVRFEDPVKLFYPETAAPSGCTFYFSGMIPQWRDSFFLGSLGLADNTFAHHVHRIKFEFPGSGNITAEEVLYRGTYGRIRNVVEGRDGYLYFMTSNGSGTDKIYRIVPN